MSETIILTGFMGTGKTTVGRALAARLERPFVDTDALIEKRAGKSIADIFADDGEAAFREMEAAAGGELAGQPGLVIATGGRLMLDRDNADALSDEARVFCLTAVPETILQRLEGDRRRPLLNGPDVAGRIQLLLDVRARDYGRFPQIPTDGRTVDEVVEVIIHRLQCDTLIVRADRQRYEVIVGPDLLARWRALSGTHGPTAVITDSNVGPLYADRLGDVDCLRVISAGERHKTLRTVQKLYGDLVHCGLDRGGTIVALGGGVVGDVAGFVAATYLRGVRLVQCPTSLLAMVDASVGGKTGVDLPQGKNLVGAFKQPAAVLADVSVLATLPPAEFRAGLAEVVKHGLIADPALLEILETDHWVLENGQYPTANIQSLITKAIEVKRTIVQQDPFESGRRAVLNLGHTFGHAVERETGYAVGHGQAVAMGLAAAAHLSAALGHCDAALPARIEALLARLALPTRLPSNLTPEALLAAMGSDKKRSDGRLRFVLLRDVGDVFVSGDVAETAVLATLAALATGREVHRPQPKRKRIYYKHLSKKISHALRHRPERYGLVLDAEGWAPVADVLATMRKRRRDWRKLDETDLAAMMAASDKRRFEMRDGRIRALYGHSTPGRIEHEARVPPPALYHGAPPDVAGVILGEGLKPMGRQYVHLSADVDTAEKVGRRRSRQPAVLVIDAAAAHAAGVAFYQTGDDGTWLSDPIPPAHITPLDDPRTT